MISVVVPCFNTERVMSRCIESLLKQTYRDLEIILVNDGSSDGTLACMQRYSQLDERVEIVDLKHNRGLGQARFSGIIAAKGEYIVFLDADDWIPSNGIQILFQTMQRTNADIVEGSMVRVLGRTSIIKRVHHKQELEITQPELFENYFISFFGINRLGVNLWGKIYRRSLFASPGVCASEYIMGEDLILNMRLFPYVKKYVTISDVVYYYCIGGMTSKYNTHFYPDLKAQYYYKLQTIREYNYEKALQPTMIEMCNILCSQVRQMLLYGKSLNIIEEFIKNEIDSGFIDEISGGVSYHSAILLARKDPNYIIATLRKGLWKAKLRRALYSLFK